MYNLILGDIMTNRKIQMPREVYIDPGIIHDTAEICKTLHLDKKFLIVTGSHTFDVGAKPVIELMWPNYPHSIKMCILYLCQQPLHMTVSYLLWHQ